jgi:hypothetical protein
MKPLLLLTLIILPVQQHLAQDRPTRETPAPSVGGRLAGTPRYTLLNINNITAWLRSDGQSAHSPTGAEGVVYPRGTAHVVYQDGFLWAGKAFLDASFSTPAPPHTIRVGGQTYNIGTASGWVIGQGAQAVPVNPIDPGARIYRIRRDYADMGEYELQRDAAEYFELDINDVTASHIDQIRDQYRTDWTGWPVDRGAPYIERNGIPGYQPPPPLGAGFTAQDLITGNYDEPGIAGIDPSLPADQVVWTVYNDLNRVVTTALYGSEPLGLEAQVTLWGYRRTDALGNIYFQRLRIINKGGVDVGGGVKQALWIDSMFIGKWVETDLGHFADDLLGCDPPINLAFTYNSTSSDRLFQPFGIPPPAVGWNILQGPVVPGNAGDTATFDFRTIQGGRNLGMTSYSPRWTSGGFGDPPFSYEGSLQWWRWIQGYRPDPSTSPWRPYSHPPGVPVTKFPLSGDPITRTGFIDGLGTLYSGPPGNRSHTLSSGPFTLAPGDTQEVIIAVIGGLGADHLTSITAMKFNDRTARQMQATRFAFGRPPSPPKVNTIELDGEVILEWGSDLQRVRESEEPVYAGGYAFEGYTVYQLPRRNAPLGEGKRIATFDVVNGVAAIIDEMFDPNTGLVVPVILQEGSNSGVQRHLRIARNHLTDFGVPSRLFNGQEYYFAVTAYSYSAQGSYPKSLESNPALVVARPRVPFGTDARTSYGDTLAVQHVAGSSTGFVHPIVVDPLAGTGDTYRVGFDTTGGTTTWYVRNHTQNRLVIEGQTNLSGDTDYPIIEGGVYLQIISPPPGLKRQDMFDTIDSSQWGWKWIPNITTRFLTWAGGDGLGLEGFRGAAGWSSPRRIFTDGVMIVRADQLKSVEIHFAPTLDAQGNFNTAHLNASYAYRYGRNFSFYPGPTAPPCIVNPAGGYAYQDYTISVPLAVYDVDASPPRRLAVGFLENNVAGGDVNCRYWPPSIGIDNVAASGPREWLFIFDADYTGPNPDTLMQGDLLTSNAPVMYMATWARRNDNPWPEGNIMALYPNKPQGAADVYEYVSIAPDKGTALRKASAGRVGVFPNPYYAGQAAGPFTQGRFVTFNNLPPKAIIRIYNLAGHLVRTLRKDEPSQFLVWDLKNENDWLIASGMYICHVEMPEVGEVKILKLAVIQDALIPPVR